MKRKILLRLFSLLLVAVVLVLGLCSCTMEEDNEVTREICEDYIDAVIENDFEDAYRLFDEIATREQFGDLWSYTRDVLANSKSYELEHQGWHTETNDGFTLRQVSYELVSDDGKIMQFTVVLDDEGVYGFNALDSTAFVENTGFVRIMGAVMTIISLALFGVSIWMIVDVCKRKIRNKALWILLILIGFWLEISVGIEAGHFDFDFGMFLLLKTSTAYTINAVEAIGVRVAFPIGMIVYFFIRKSLSAREEAIAAREAAEAEAKAAAEQEALAEVHEAVDEDIPEDAPAEEPTEEKTEDQ
jgi:hypothetical protein